MSWKKLTISRSAFCSNLQQVCCSAKESFLFCNTGKRIVGVNYLLGAPSPVLFRMPSRLAFLGVC